MNSSSDYTFSYVSGTQVWSVKPAKLPPEMQAQVLLALQDGHVDPGELAKFAQWQNQFPEAFSKRSFLESLPPPEAFLDSSRSWEGMGVDAMMAMLNEKTNTLSADLRQESNKLQLDQNKRSLELGEQKMQAQKNAAADAFAAAVVEAALAIFAAVLSTVAAVTSQVFSAKDLVKAKDLAKEKANALCDKFKHQGEYESLERNARKLDEKVSLANKAAADAHPIGLKSSKAIAKKQNELLSADQTHMNPAQKTAHQDEIKRVTTALECKLEAETQQVAATKAHAKADVARKKMEDAEISLSDAEESIRQLDATSQQRGNFYRLVPTATPMFEQLGRILGAIYTQNGKNWDAQADFYGYLIQNSESYGDLAKNQASSFSDLNNASRKTYEDYVNGQNEVNRSIASHV